MKDYLILVYYITYTDMK